MKCNEDIIEVNESVLTNYHINIETFIYLLPTPTHPDEMAAILVDYIFKCIFLTGNDKISLKLVPMSPIDNNPALPEPMLNQFTDICMRH